MSKCSEKDGCGCVVAIIMLILLFFVGSINISVHINTKESQEKTWGSQ